MHNFSKGGVGLLKICWSISTHGVGVSSYITNLFDKQASKQAKCVNTPNTHLSLKGGIWIPQAPPSVHLNAFVYKSLQ